MDALRVVYREFVAGEDPARGWLESGAPDCRFSDQAPLGSVVRGPRDLHELGAVLVDLFGTDAWPEPAWVPGEQREVVVPVVRPARLIPLVEALRPELEHRILAFWTWKSAREAVANRLASHGTVTLVAVCVGEGGNNAASVTPPRRPAG